jgi:hypothetical protein
MELHAKVKWSFERAGENSEKNSAAWMDALVNPHVTWAPHPRITDPTTISANGERMGLQLPEESKVWLPSGSHRFAK